ncbi:MAG: 16S rRNA (adenine(1518)-N(6)/adenine(1519)-N(6))-dimethyltransferase RsmA [Solobacterium sp.]|nr:16S rRNA (adenine(1518)-N(6)/adenine(1519)-N(6))-dimethyltransferase RsmA [Solobacterium sp.]
MNKPIAAPSRTGEILNQYGLRAKKGFGQNFLIDVSVVSRIAENAHCEGAVIEVGPGIGSLSEQLALRSRHVRSYEVDERLLPVLADTLSAYDNVEIILQDILEADLAASVKELKEKYGTVSLCANLPYYITTPVLFRLFECPETIEWITVMVQKEVAERFATGPGNKEYGALSVEASLLYEVKKLFNVPRTCFSPAPNVDSAVIQFHRRELIPAAQTSEFFAFVRGCFVQRRKTLYNNLKSYFTENEDIAAILEEAGIDPGVRAQNMDAQQFIALYEVWRKQK